MRERAVSEVVSFTLVFSLIAVTVGVVYVGGLGNLQNARDAEQLQNAERAFDVLDDNVNDIVRGEAPNRGTEIKLAGAQLYFGTSTKLNVTTNKSSSSEPYTVELRPIVYRADESMLVYEAGAVLREDRGEAVVNAEAPVTLDLDQSLVQFVQTRKLGDSPTSVGGEETVLVRTSASDRDVLAGRTDGPYAVTFNVTTNRTAAWERTLENEIEESGVALGSSPQGFDTDPCQVHGSVVMCKFATEDLYVSVTRINVEFS